MYRCSTGLRGRGAVFVMANTTRKMPHVGISIRISISISMSNCMLRRRNRLQFDTSVPLPSVATERARRFLHVARASAYT